MPGLLVKFRIAFRHLTRHEKTDLKVFVVVIPKVGWVRMAAPILLWYNTEISEFDSADIIDYIL